MPAIPKQLPTPSYSPTPVEKQQTLLLLNLSERVNFLAQEISRLVLEVRELRGGRQTKDLCEENLRTLSDDDISF